MSQLKVQLKPQVRGRPGTRAGVPPPQITPNHLKLVVPVQCKLLSPQSMVFSFFCWHTTGGVLLCTVLASIVSPRGTGVYENSFSCPDGHGVPDFCHVTFPNAHKH